jgi:hypothetical protein
MSAPAARARMSAGLRIARCLPLSVAVTAAVTLLPLLAVAQLGPARTALVVAMLIARALAALWIR